MSPCPLELVPTGLLALPGAAGAMALAGTSGALAAGDDRGETGLWDRTGTRLGGWRLRGAVAWADVDDAPGGARAAFVTVTGEALVAGGAGTPLRLALRPDDRILLDRTGAGFFVITPSTGDVTVHDPFGRPARHFKAPGPVWSAIAVPRTGGIATATREGVLGRFTPWGALSWGGDYKRYTGALAVDPGGERIVVSFLALGAEVLHPSSGGCLGILDVGHAVECAAASLTHFALGCSDGTITLHDRAGQVVAQGRAPSRVLAIGVADDGALFVRLGDGTVRRWGTRGAGRGPTTGAGLGSAPSARAAHRALARSGTASARPAVHVAADGSAAAVEQANRQVVVVAADGALVAESGHQGILLALHARSPGDVLAVTTRELRHFTARGGDEVRRFTVEQMRAVWSADGSVFAAADEVGTVRLADGTFGADLAEVRLAQGETVDRIFATRVAAAVQTRSGQVHSVLAGGAFDVVVDRAGEVPRLAGATAQGPIVILGSEVVSCSWNGQERWSHRSPVEPVAVLVLPDDRILVVLRDTLLIVGRDGRAGAPMRRPEGEPAAVAGGDETVVAWRDGRRVTVAGVDGRVVFADTFDAPVRAVALSEGGCVVAVVLDGRLVVARTVPDAAAVR